MIKKVILFILFPFISILLFPEKAVDQKITELEKRLLKATGIGKVDLLNDLGKKYQNINPEKCLYYSNQALALAKELKYPKGEAKALNNIGISYKAIGQYDLALKFYTKSLIVFEEIGEKLNIAGILNNIANIYSSTGKYGQALQYCQKSLKMHEEISNKNGIGTSLHNIGLIYCLMGKYDYALEYYHKSLKIYEELGDKSNLVRHLNNIGTIFKTMGKYDRALAYCIESLKIAEEIQDKSSIGASLNNIGLIYKELGKYDQALKYHQKSLQVREEIGDKRGISGSLNNIGCIYSDALAKNEQALEFYNKSLKIAEKIGEKKGIAIALNNIGIVYLNLKMPKNAIEKLTVSLKMAKKLNTRDLIKANYEYLSKAYEIKIDYQKSLDYFKLFSSVKDTIFNEETNKKIAELQVSYDTLKKEKEIKELRNENKIQGIQNQIQRMQNRYNKMIGGALLIVLAVTSFFFIRHYRQNLIQEKEKQRHLQIESKLRSLQNKINPHFLFNTLNSIIQVGYGNEPGKIEHMVTNLADMYRKVLYLPDDFLVTLEEELGLIKNYLEIENIRFAGRLEFDISAENEILSSKILPLTVQTLVENSIKHGISEKEEGGKVEVKAYKENESLKIKVKDNGVGFDPEGYESGFGVASVQERMRLFYKDKAKFNINSNPGQGTEIILEVPYD